MTTFKGKFEAPADPDHYRRALAWLRQNVPELKEITESEWIAKGRRAVEATKARD